MENDIIRTPLSSAAVLRFRAEERMGKRTAELPLPQNMQEAQRLVHELEVHQVELVMQNEELRQARFETESELKRYTSLYESAPGGSFTLDRSGLITAANLAAADLVRIERSLLIGRSFSLFVAEEYRPAFTTFVNSLFSNHGNQTLEVVILNNVSIPLTVQIEASACASGEECRLSLIDITGQRRDGPEQKEASVSTAMPDKLELELSVCTLRNALDAALLMLRDEAAKGVLNITTELASEVDERIVADAGMLKQIIFSLLANAIRFTPAGGTITVRGVREADFIKITVTDTGLGIRAEDLPMLFEAFTALESVYTRTYEGSGLGLALTRQLVELHGGSLWVESECGMGSSFSFTIPLKSGTGIT